MSPSTEILQVDLYRFCIQNLAPCWDPNPNKPSSHWLWALPQANQRMKRPARRDCGWLGMSPGCIHYYQICWNRLLIWIALDFFARFKSCFLWSSFSGRHWSWKNSWPKLRVYMSCLPFISLLDSQKKIVTNYFTSCDPHHDIYRFVTGKSSGILSDISSGIRSGISSGILPGISSGVLSGILSGISSDILSGILSGKSWAFYLANSLALYLTYLMAFDLAFYLAYLLAFYLT